MHRTIRHHRGSIYLPVFATAMIVSIIALSANWMVRLQGRNSRVEQDYLQARLLAQSAVEMGLREMDQNASWRTSWAGGALPNLTLGAGKVSLQAVDPADGNLANSEEDSVVLTGIGAKGLSRHKTQVTLISESVPVASLESALHAGQELRIGSSDRLTVVGSAGSTNANLRLDGVLDGDAEAATRTGGGTVTGQSDIPAPGRALPDAAVFGRYKNLATTIPYTGNIDDVVLGPGRNPWGAENADGVYYLDTFGHDITLRGIRLRGTLVINAPGREVTIQDAVFMEPARSDYPVLIINGNADLAHRSKEYQLSESFWWTNFNPPGEPYEGHSDYDWDDDYPNEIRGLVHVKGRLIMRHTAIVRGAVIAEGIVVIDNSPSVFYEPSLRTDPPVGYYTSRMRVVPGSWQQTVD